MHFSEAELLEAVRAAMKSKPEDTPGLTSEEIAESMGVSVQTARKYLKVLLKAGKAKCVRVWRVRMNGINKPGDGYALT